MTDKNDQGGEYSLNLMGAAYAVGVTIWAILKTMAALCIWIAVYILSYEWSNTR